MAKILPVILALVGLLGGLGAGYALKPDAASCHSATPGEDKIQGDQAKSAGYEGSAGECAAPDEPEKGAGKASGSSHDDPDSASAGEFAKLPTQFVVPVLEGGRMRALVVMSISLEVAPGSQESVFTLEPKLRDSFLKVLFRHANSGGFDGNFTDRRVMQDLRGSLFEAAEKILGDKLIQILILDLLRQDLG